MAAENRFVYLTLFLSVVQRTLRNSYLGNFSFSWAQNTATLQPVSLGYKMCLTINNYCGTYEQIHKWELAYRVYRYLYGC